MPVPTAMHRVARSCGPAGRVNREGTEARLAAPGGAECEVDSEFAVLASTAAACTWSATSSAEPCSRTRGDVHRPARLRGRPDRRWGGGAGLRRPRRDDASRRCGGGLTRGNGITTSQVVIDEACPVLSGAIFTGPAMQDGCTPRRSLSSARCSWRLRRQTAAGWRTTTERSTSPRCMRANASSTSSIPTRSLMRASRSKRPRR